MIRTVLNHAYRVDQFLSHTVGRPYHMLLAAGLVFEIFNHFKQISEAAITTSGLVRTAATVGFLLVLLLSQLADLHQAFVRRDQHKAGPKA